MKTIEIPTDNPVKMIWAIREKHYEETKNMTPDEKSEYTRSKVVLFRQLKQEVNPNDYDFPFLRGKNK